MNILKTSFILAGSIGVMSFGGSNLMAQSQSNSAPVRVETANGHHAHWRPISNMDVLRRQLGMSGDTRWAEVSERIASVLDARLAVVGELDRGLGEPRDLFPVSFGPETKAELALRRAVKFDAPDEALKAQLANVRAAARMEQQSREQAYLKAQDDLRALLAPRQEARLTLDGILE